jgi:hypothetical protein
VDAKAKTNQQREMQRAKAGGGWQLVAGKESVHDSTLVSNDRQMMQQPTINRSGKGWWGLATRAREQWLVIGNKRGQLPSCDDAP